jgi:hypothetical protein
LWGRGRFVATEGAIVLETPSSVFPEGWKRPSREAESSTARKRKEEKNF